ncbi:MAG: D-alanyl-D-alanine carboxypeptidase/D-alanyl-D-alanine-endopeptidase [Bacteroidota bacterium]
MIRLWILCAVLSIANQNQGQSNLSQKLNGIIDNNAFEYATVGLSVKTLDGENVVDINADKKLIPASSLKLVTTFLALKEFGKDYTFTTHIGYNGKIDRAGTLQGDIIIIGSGDPTFGSSRYGEGNSWKNTLTKVVDSIKKAGITCVDGKIEVKTHVFQGQAICPSWPYSDIANYYGSGAWGLNFNENKYNLYFSANVPEGDIATLDYISPEIPNMHLRSEVVIKGPKTGDNAYIYGDPFHYSKIIRGSIPYSKSQFVIKGAIPNPPLSFAFILEKELERAGIKSNGSNTSKTSIKKSEFSSLISFKSPPLYRIIQEANYESINLYCEALLRKLGWKSKKDGSFEAGLEFVEDQLTDMGIPENSFNINDGSGLSPRNTLTPHSFTSFINAVYLEWGSETMMKYIPHVGVSGTVRNLMNKKSGQKKFYLKSGSIGGVLTYTGLFQSKSGKEYSICFMSNNHSKGNRRVRIQAEKILQLLYNQL